MQLFFLANYDKAWTLDFETRVYPCRTDGSQHEEHEAVAESQAKRYGNDCGEATDNRVSRVRRFSTEICWRAGATVAPATIELHLHGQRSSATRLIVTPICREMMRVLIRSACINIGETHWWFSSLMIFACGCLCRQDGFPRANLSSAVKWPTCANQTGSSRSDTKRVCDIDRENSTAL